MDSTLVAVVTGAHRGIGFEVCRQLARRGVHVVLTALEAEAGRSAQEALAGEGLAVETHPLDVADAASADALKTCLERKFGRIDILVNNAAIISEVDAGILDVGLDAIRQTLEINCYGALRICQTMMPLLRKSPSGRIVNVSSASGSLSLMKRDHVAYRISKTALNAVTVLLAVVLEDAPIAVNTMCPGWVRTDLGGPDAPRSVEEGADTIVWLALDAPLSLRGQFLRDREKHVPW